jgi:hypothetical protein
MLVTPIERRTPISAVCLKRFDPMLAESAKKHKNMLMIMIVSKTLFSILTDLGS